MSDRVITVALDPTLHPGAEPRDEVDRLVWEVLDTTWNLFREYAVRVTLAEVRRQSAEQGRDFPSDEEVFAMARQSGDPDAPKGYLDLAPSTPLVAAALAGAFDALADEAFREASEGLGFTISEEG